MVSSTLRPVADNRLLAALPVADLRRILGGCETVELARTQLLYAPWEPLDGIYFPTGGYISLTLPNNDFPSFEVGLVGNEGVLGTALAHNVDTSPERATVHGAGTALRMLAATLRRELGRSDALRGGINRYISVRASHLAQAAICAQFHLLQARVACRLLMTHDRVTGNSFTLTQESLALKLGARRAGVTRAASALKQRCLIRYDRGSVTVLDRRGLMAAACSCYKADRDSYNRIIGTADM